MYNQDVLYFLKYKNVRLFLILKPDILFIQKGLVIPLTSNHLQIIIACGT